MKLPSEYTDRLKQQLKDDFSDFMRCMDEPPYKALRINRRKMDPSDYAALTGSVTGCDDPVEVPHVPGAYYYTDAQPGRSPLHEAGAFYIQEPSAMIPVTMLDAGGDHLRVLDLCAAPGGKTTQIADCMGDGGLLVANEIIPSRAAILSENIERMGVTNALVISADPADLPGRFEGFFDRILVDAPCSGEGMFRKNPEATGEWSPENVKRCADRQDMILDNAAKMLKEGGKLVYSTCTFSPDEDEGTMERFLQRHPDFSVCECRRIWPHEWPGEGHFAVSFERKSSEDSLRDWRPVGHPQSSVASLKTFLDECICDSCRIKQDILNDPGRLISFGDSLYLAPAGTPDISGLKVLRAGLKIGCFKKMRFEPDHALSHALTPGDVKLYVDLDPDGNEVRAYLSGMTIPCDKEMKGWCLVCTGGFALGWGKAAGGMIKNHYPKGLRRQASV